MVESGVVVAVIGSNSTGEEVAERTGFMGVFVVTVDGMRAASGAVEVAGGDVLATSAFGADSVEATLGAASVITGIEIAPAENPEEALAARAGAGTGAGDA